MSYREDLLIIGRSARIIEHKIGDQILVMVRNRHGVLNVAYKGGEIILYRVQGGEATDQVRAMKVRLIENEEEQERLTQFIREKGYTEVIDFYPGRGIK